MHTFRQFSVKSTSERSSSRGEPGVSLDIERDKLSQVEEFQELQELKLFVKSESAEESAGKPLERKMNFRSISFVERARLDLQAQYVYVHSHYFMDPSVYMNRMQVASMISRAIDRAVEMQCDEILEHAYQDAIAVILPNWRGKKSQLQLRLEKTLKDLGTGRVRFHSAREERYLSDMRHLKEKMCVLEIALSEKVKVNEQLQDQNQKLWQQNRMLNGVLAQCADKLGIGFSAVDVAPAASSSSASRADCLQNGAERGVEADGEIPARSAYPARTGAGSYTPESGDTSPDSSTSTSFYSPF